MKRIIIIILLSILGTICAAQNNSLYKTVFPSKTNGYSWQLLGNVCTGCGAGYVGIERSIGPNEFGNYQYTIYLYSSSYNLNNLVTYSYFQKIKIYGNYNGQWAQLDNVPPFDLIVGLQNTVCYTLFSADPNYYILVTIGDISAYH